MCHSVKYLITIPLFVNYLFITNNNLSFSKENNINLNNDNQTNSRKINDPFEKINRKIFFFNAVIWHTVVIPFGRVYVKLPIELRNTFTNYGKNYITEPTNMLYSVFDFDF